MGCSSRNQFAVQPDNKVSYVLPLTFRFGLGARGSKGVLGDGPIIYDMCNGVDEDPLTLGQVEDDVLFWAEIMVASWPFKMRASLSWFSVNNTFMSLTG